MKEFDDTSKISNPKLETGPEDIQREFENFVRSKYGDRVQIISHAIENLDHKSERVSDQKKDRSNRSSIKGQNSPVLDFDTVPLEIKNYLDRFVIKQDEAKRALAIAVCDHYNHVKSCLKNPEIALQDYAKQNVLILGPTGVGKTYLVKNIAKLIGVPFVKADATRFSETGYMGANVDDLIHELVNQAGGDLELAQFGIVYLDEADKLAASTDNQRAKDVSGRGVQFGMLKLMEETEVDLRGGNDMRSQMNAFMEFQKKGKLEPKVINTKHILFIISGAFTQLSTIVKSRLSVGTIGFSKSETDQFQVGDASEYLKFAGTQDFIDFGYEPEFIGRLPVRVACVNLDENDLFHILTESEGSVLKQFVRSFASYGIHLSFSEAALRMISKMAALEKTGARSLVTVLEKILRDAKFELPSREVEMLYIDEFYVRDPGLQLAKLLASLPIRAKKTSVLQSNQESEIVSAEEQSHFFDFSRKFLESFQIDLQFTEGARLICLAYAKNHDSLPSFLNHHLSGIENKLRLIRHNTGRTRFVLDQVFIANPHSTLEEWLRDSAELL